MLIIATTYVNYSLKNLEYTPSDAFCVSLNDFEINGDIICKAIDRLKTSYNPGPDGIPTIVAKKCADALRAPLETVFTASLKMGIFPEPWKFSWEEEED